jgi:hypothetical protein
MKGSALGAALLGLMPLQGIAQAIDSVIVEIFHVRESKVEGEAPLTTYRIFIDLAAGHELQMVYGDDRHSLKIETTTSFHNELERGVRYADRLNASSLEDPAIILDSWLTIVAVSDQYAGVPKAMDDDGSIVQCPPPIDHHAGASGEHPDARLLCPVDGLLKVPGVREVVNFDMDPSYLGKIRGSVIGTTNGAWAVLGGVKGVTEENIVLLAQVTTTGELSFRFNLQIETPDHQPVKYVALDPGEGEILFEGLSYGSASHR